MPWVAKAIQSASRRPSHPDLRVAIRTKSVVASVVVRGLQLFANYPALARHRLQHRLQQNLQVRA